MSEVRTRKSVENRSVFIEAEFGDELLETQLLQAVEERVVKRLVDMYLDAYGDEILATIDLESVKKKTNEKVTVQALKELVKD